MQALVGAIAASLSAAELARLVAQLALGASPSQVRITSHPPCV